MPAAHLQYFSVWRDFRHGFITEHTGSKLVQLRCLGPIWPLFIQHLSVRGRLVDNTCFTITALMSIWTDQRWFTPHWELLVASLRLDTLKMRKTEEKRKGNERAMGEASTETGECYKLNGTRAWCQATHLKSSHLTLASPSPPSIFLPLVWTECSPEAGTLILCQSSTTKLSVRDHFIPVLGGMRQQFLPPHKTCNGGKKDAIRRKGELKGKTTTTRSNIFLFSQAIKTWQSLSRHILYSLIAQLTFLIVWLCFEMVTWPRAGFVLQ